MLGQSQFLALENHIDCNEFANSQNIGKSFIEKEHYNAKGNHQ